ncbi:reverse transcriptase N-terminal domain-containing protein [Oscillatoria sp. HE19RPO]|uniref:reverse transcriptase N-terminal domain-containing protein n=1 Tax=Oscillatoria sp. HE19RPO TaxID=2954806 RepID=UPI0035C80A3D
MSNTSQSTPVEWNNLNWRKLERAVFKLQNRILRTAQRGDEKAVRKLQKTLARSWSAKCLAIRENLKKVHPYPARNRSGCQGNCRKSQPQGVEQKWGGGKCDRSLSNAQQIRPCTQKLSLLFKANKTAKLEDLIPKIHTIIQDWRNQNPHPGSAKLLKRLHHDLHQIVMHWGRRRTGSYHRAYHLYWQQLDGISQLVKNPS